MERIKNDCITVIYNRVVWSKRGAKVKKLINALVIIGILSIATILFIKTTKNHKNIKIILGYALVLLIIANMLINCIERIIYKNEIPLFKFIDWVYNIRDIRLLYKDNKIFVRYKTKLRIPCRKELSKVLKGFNCKYKIDYIDDNYSKDNRICISVDTISFEYIKIDAVI